MGRRGQRQSRRHVGHGRGRCVSVSGECRSNFLLILVCGATFPPNTTDGRKCKYTSCPRPRCLPLSICTTWTALVSTVNSYYYRLLSSVYGAHGILFYFFFWRPSVIRTIIAFKVAGRVLYFVKFLFGVFFFFFWSLLGLVTLRAYLCVQKFTEITDDFASIPSYIFISLDDSNRLNLRNHILLALFVI